MTIDISDIKPGDTITATFNVENYGEFAVTGTAREVAPGAIDLAGYVVRHREGSPGASLVEVTRQIPVEPPTGLYVDEFSDYWIHLPEGWMRLLPGIVVANVTPWADGAASTYSMTEVTA